MRKFAILAMLLTAVLPGAAIADGGTGNLQIKTIIVEPSGTWLELSNAPNPDNCGSVQRLKLIEAAGVTERMYAAALTAKTGHTPVNLWLSGCTTSPWGYTAPIVYSITLPE